MRHLRERLENEVQQRIPGIQVNGEKARRLPNTSNISIQFVESDTILALMDQLGICASSSSACTSGSTEPSHVLQAMGIPYTMARGVVRFSLSAYNTAGEIDYVVEHLTDIVQGLRRNSPNWKARSVCAHT